jgi:hypothetical protein
LELVPPIGSGSEQNSRRDRASLGVHLDARYTPEQQLSASSPPSSSTPPDINPEQPAFPLHIYPHAPSIQNHTRPRRASYPLAPSFTPEKFPEPNTWLLYVYPLRSYHSQRHRSFTNLNGHAASFSAARLLASIHPERRHPAFRSCPRGQASRP